MNFSKLKEMRSKIKNPNLANKIDFMINKRSKSPTEDKDEKPKIDTVNKQCSNCKSTNLSYAEGIICMDCGVVLKITSISTAEENSVNFSKISNRSSSYMEYNGLGSAYNLQSCISGGTKTKSKQYNNTHIIQKNYQHETRLKNIQFIKKVMSEVSYVPKTVVDSAIKAYIKFKIDGNTNRAEINKGIMAAFIKKSGFDYGIELTNKKIADIFDINIKHVTKGIQIIIEHGIVFNYDLNSLMINYIKYHFRVLSLPREYINNAIFLALFIIHYMNKITASFIPHSIAAWVTFYTIIYYKIDIGIDINLYKSKMNLYASKVKALFDNHQASVIDVPGKKREHIVSNVNITKVDNIMEEFKPKLNQILESLNTNSEFLSIKNY